MASSHVSPASSPGVPIESEPRLCWVCQMDETEDGPNTVWKSPCPCSLTAHDDCLLEWISAKEIDSKGAYQPEVKCPQCQATIKIQRPHDYLVQGYGLVSNAARSLMLPTALSGLAGCLYSGFFVYGVNTLRVVFGEEGMQNLLLRPVPKREAASRLWHLLHNFDWTLESAGSVLGEFGRLSMRHFDLFFPEKRLNSTWKLYFGIPLIGPALIFSRTKWAEYSGALLLPLHFLTHPTRNTFDITQITSSPGIMFALLPYISSIYTEAYKHSIAPYEKKWDATLVRRTPQEEPPAPEQPEGDGGFIADFGAGILEIQVHEEFVDQDGNVVPDPNAAVPPPPPPLPQPNVNGAIPEVNGPPGGDNEAANPNPNPNAPNANGNDRWQLRQDIPLSSLLASTMGSLFLPTIASYSGELLKHALPKNWVNKGPGLRNSGFLKEQWGRTIAGGCLFILLKDAVTLYVKWKRARDFGKRKVLDYVGERRRGGA